MNTPFVLPGGGRKVAIAGDVYQIKLTGAETGGRCAVFEFFVPPGGGPPPHVHRREEEMFYVLEGELTFTVADTKFVVPAGGFLNAVRDVPHAFKNEGNVPARAVVVVSPAGLEEYFFEVGIPWDDAYRTPGPPPPDQLARMAAAAPNYGLEILAPPH
jgi:quercetin dioxygenase-like cupin family protein